jgi:hypothetical protein
MELACSVATHQERLEATAISADLDSIQILPRSFYTVTRNTIARF